jgi:hypothetical protein
VSKSQVKTLAPDGKPSPTAGGLGEGAGAQALAGGAPTIAGLRATAGLDVLREALEVLANVVARGNAYINVDASDVLYADIVPDYRNEGCRSVYLLLRGGIEVEASELDGHVRVRSIHECYCGG